MEQPITPFILQTAKDYDMPVDIVQKYYHRFGCTTMFYNMLEDYIKNRANQ